MVKVGAPCFSLAAEGTLARCLNFIRRFDYYYVRGLTSPWIQPTALRTVIQGHMRHTVWTYQNLDPSIPPLWKSWAATYMPSASGFNAFTSYYMTSLIQGTLPDLFPPT